MQPVIEQRIDPASRLALSRPTLLAMAALGAGVVAFGLLFLPEIRAAVSTWNTSTAYGHCYLVLPMALYLIWERRAAITGVPVRSEPALAVLAIPIAAAWLLAERLGIMEGRQLMAVAGLEVLLLAVLGRRLFRTLAGPLLFLVFLVPFGAFLTPWLQHFTAVFSKVGLDLLGIPNYTDDLIIEIPAGTFFVAEACAGLRFLIAAIAFGAFYALLNYRSPGRRMVFIAASIVVPIIANGFRALGIVVLGHILGSAEAAAADHVIYGWVFFSFVMLLLVVAGMPLREPAATSRPAVGGLGETGHTAAPIGAALCAVAALAVGPGAAALLNARVVSAPLAAVPALQMPPGCLLAGDVPSGPATRLGFKVACDGNAFEVALEAFPARSTASALSAERRRATGELEAEDTSARPLLSGGGQGDWTLVQTLEPFRTTALASWTDGRPARTGVAGRIAQARSSIFGSDHAAVLMTIIINESSRPPPDTARRLADTITKFVEAQTNLTEQIATISRQ